MCTKATKNFRLVVVNITAAKQEWNLSDNEDLQQAKRIVAVQAYRVGDVSHAPDGTPVVNNTVFNKSFLSFQTNDNQEKIQQFPFPDLNRKDNNGELVYVDIPPIAPTKCKIKIATAAGIVVDESFLLGVHYEL